jgi:RecA-family ATPase
MAFKVIESDDPPTEPRIETKEAPIPQVLDASDDLTPPPPRQWLFGNIFCREFLSSLFGDGGVGKTALRYAQYLSLAIGRSLTGEHVFQRCRVLIVSLEDSDVELRRRVWALRIRYNIKSEELKDHLFLWAPKASDGKLMELDKYGNLRPGGLRGSLEALIAAKNIDLVGIDPFVKLHSVGENDNTLIDKVAGLLTEICHKFNIAADAPHHVNKAQNKDSEPGDANRGRGASALKDAARLVYTLNVMTKEEAKTFGIREEDRWAYVRMDKGKVNIVPPSRKAT